VKTRAAAGFKAANRKKADDFILTLNFMEAE
jgi:hypothetical protein